MKNNNQMFKALAKEMSNEPVLEALLRERLVTMMKMTAKDIAKNPEAYNNAFVTHHAYLRLAEIVENHLGFDNK